MSAHRVQVKKKYCIAQKLFSAVSWHFF